MTAVFPLWMQSPSIGDQPADAALASPPVDADDAGGEFTPLPSGDDDERAELDIVSPPSSSGGGGLVRPPDGGDGGGPVSSERPSEQACISTSAAGGLHAKTRRRGEAAEMDECIGEERAGLVGPAAGAAGAVDASSSRRASERLVKGLVALIIMCYCGAEASFGAWVAIGENVILLPPPPLPVAGVSIGNEEGMPAK